MELDEVIGRELYEIYRESHDPGELPAWDEANDWDGWEIEDANFSLHDLWIAQGHRVNKVIADWNTQQIAEEYYRKQHEHDDCLAGDECKVSEWSCHCSLGLGYGGKLGQVPPAHTHK